MIRSLFTYVLVIVSVVGFAGCDNLGDTLTDVDSPGATAVVRGADNEGINKNILGYEVEFAGSLYNGQQTTFSYKVTRPPSSQASPNYFFLESPACAAAPVSFHPTQSASIDTEGGLSGIRWNSPGISPAATATFSVTYNGDIPVGSISIFMKVGSSTESDQLDGACKGIPNLVNISGSVFVDAMSNGLFDANETGFGKVTVDLLDGNGKYVESKTTAADGSYLFQVAPGVYSLDVPASTSSVTDFNENLYAYFIPTSPTPIPPGLISTNSTENDFGFEPDDATITTDLKSGTIATNTETAAWWSREFANVIKGKGKPAYDVLELNGFLIEIGDLLLPQIFQFNGADALSDALTILSRPIRSDDEMLQRELLAAELNHVAGLGSTSSEFDLAVLAFAESDWVSKFGPASKTVGEEALGKTMLRSTTLLAAFNDSGTGSGGGSLKRGQSE